MFGQRDNRPPTLMDRLKGPLFAVNAATWNLPIYRPGRKGHVESYFLKGNDPETKKAFWIKFTILAPLSRSDEVVAEVWAILFEPAQNRVLGFKQSFPIDRCRLESTPRIQIGPDSFYAEGLTRGRITGKEERTVAWDLSFDPAPQALVLMKYRWSFTSERIPVKLVSPHPDVRFDGEIRLDQRTWWKLDQVPGMQGHNWGKRHALRYGWVHCNLFEGGGRAVFEGGSSRIKLARLPAVPASVGMLWLDDGSRHHFDLIHNMCYQRWTLEPYRYTFCYSNRTHHLKGIVQGEPELTVCLVYRNPDGSETYCHNSKTATLDLELSDRSGRVVRKLHSKQAAAFEHLTTEPYGAACSL